MMDGMSCGLNSICTRMPPFLLMFYNVHLLHLYLLSILIVLFLCPPWKIKHNISLLPTRVEICLRPSVCDRNIKHGFGDTYRIEKFMLLPLV